MKQNPSLLVLAHVVGLQTRTAFHALIPINDAFKRRRSLLPKLAKVLAQNGEDANDVKFSFKTNDVTFGDFDSLAEALSPERKEKMGSVGFVIYSNPDEIERIMADVEAGKYEMVDASSASFVFTQDECRVTAMEAIGLIKLATVPFQSKDILFAEVAAAR